MFTRTILDANNMYPNILHSEDGSVRNKAFTEIKKKSEPVTPIQGNQGSYEQTKQNTNKASENTQAPPFVPSTYPYPYPYPGTPSYPHGYHYPPYPMGYPHALNSYYYYPPGYQYPLYSMGYQHNMNPYIFLSPTSSLVLSTTTYSCTIQFYTICFKWPPPYKNLTTNQFLHTLVHQFQ